LGVREHFDNLFVYLDQFIQVLPDGSDILNGKGLLVGNLDRIRQSLVASVVYVSAWSGVIGHRDALRGGDAITNTLQAAKYPIPVPGVAESDALVVHLKVGVFVSPGVPSARILAFALIPPVAIVQVVSLHFQLVDPVAELVVKKLSL
jgi:hypothetical protein